MKALLLSALLISAGYLIAQQASGQYNCSTLHGGAQPAQPGPGCLGVSNFSVSQAYQVSVLSNNTYATTWGPHLDSVSGSGVCLGIGISYSVMPSFFAQTPAPASGAANYTFYVLVTSYAIGWVMGVPYPQITQINEGYLYPPITYCNCTSSTCTNAGCSCCTQPPEPPQSTCCGGEGGYNGGCTMTEWWNQAACAWQCVNVSPIILDIDGHGYDLTNAPGGVLFDFLGNGQKLQVSWTAAGSTNAFLVLDRDGNGVIDNGQELFGNVTPQPPCTGGARNGWLALAVYDTPAYGGNGDGIIDAHDAVWSKLLLWQDLNHDGISQPNELFSPEALCVKAISLHYVDTPYVDRNGNSFRYRGQVWGTKDSSLSRSAYDVFFTAIPAP